MPIRVFVYGTLKQGHGNHRLLAQSKFLGRCVLTGPFRLISLGGFPGLVEVGESDEDQDISGEVYQVSEDVLQSLDMLEGHPRFYTRYKITTPYKNAWAYFLPPEYLKGGYPQIALTWQPRPDEREFLDKYLNDKDISGGEEAQSA
jgi:gamma-glutamylcyclotransferase (GGCT)/AIG2-like uncharacterized protein YtfP